MTLYVTGTLFLFCFKNITVPVTPSLKYFNPLPVMCFPWSQYTLQTTNQCTVNSCRQGDTSSLLVAWSSIVWQGKHSLEQPLFFSHSVPSLLPPPCVRWPWTGTRSCCPSSASTTSRAWLWRAPAPALPLAAPSPPPPPPAAPAPPSSTRPTPWSRYQLRHDYALTTPWTHSRLTSVLLTHCVHVVMSPGEVPARCGDGFGV